MPESSEDRRVEGAGAARREGRGHARELQIRLGRGLDRGRQAVCRGDQEDHQTATVCFNNPVRFVGEPVAAVAAVDRHTPKKRCGTSRSNMKFCRLCSNQEEALKPGAPQIWPDGNLSLDVKNEAKPITEKRGNIEEGFRNSAMMSSKTATPPPSCTTRRWSRASSRGCVGRRQAHRLYAHRRHRQLPHGHGAGSGHPAENVRVVCQYMGGNFGNKNQNQDADLIAADAGETSRRAGEA